MAAIDVAASRIALPVKKLEKPEQLVAVVKDIDPNLKQALFKPMNIGDLRSKGANRARILPPELVNEIIEQHAKATMPQMPMAEVAVLNTPIQPVNYAIAIVPEPVIEEPARSPQERIMELAQEIAPSAPSAEEEVELSAEEVEKLLNG